MQSSKKVTQPFSIETNNKSFEEIRESVRDLRYENEGVICPCCGKVAHVYKRSISKASLAFLQNMHRIHRTTKKDWVYVSDNQGSDLQTPGGDYAKLRWWGLIEKQPNREREDGSSRHGYWRITQLGVSFLRGEARVRRFIYEYDGEPIPDPSNSDTSLMQVWDIDTTFNYQVIFPDLL